LPATVFGENIMTTHADYIFGAIALHSDFSAIERRVLLAIGEERLEPEKIYNRLLPLEANSTLIGLIRRRIVIEAEPERLGIADPREWAAPEIIRQVDRIMEARAEEDERREAKLSNRFGDGEPVILSFSAAVETLKHRPLFGGTSAIATDPESGPSPGHVRFK
jgi:hypothetical protein